MRRAIGYRIHIDKQSVQELIEGSVNIVRDTIRRVRAEYEGMKTHDHVPNDKNTACQCPSCVPQPARTYTQEYMQECLARWYVNATLKQRDEYLEALRKQKGWRGRIADLKAVAKRLELPTNDFPE